MVDQLERAFNAAKRIVELQSEIKDREDEIESLKAFIANLVPEGETLLGNEEDGFIKTQIYQSKMFNEAWGKKNHPDLWEKYAQPVFKLDSAMAKKVMPEEEYALFQKPSEKTTVKVEVQND